MKKICTYILVICMFIPLIFSLSGCASKISTQEAFAEFEQAIDISLSSEIYYWKEVINREQSISRKMNIYAKQASSGDYERNEDGSYTDYAMSYVESVDKKRTAFYQAGLSKSKTEGDKQLAFATKYDEKGNVTDNVIEPISVDGFLQKEFMKDKLIGSKLFDLSLLSHDDMDFSVDGAQCEKKMYLTSMQFAIKESFFSEYERLYQRQSVIKGAQIHIEIIYGKIYNITVYQRISLDDKMSDLEEDYRLNIVYMGPKEKIPDFTQVNDDNERIWKEGVI